MREKKNSMLHAINAANNKIMNGKHPELGNKTFAEAIGQGGGGTGDYNDLKNKPMWVEEGTGLNYCKVAEKLYKTIEFKDEEYSMLNGGCVLSKLTPETVTIENRIVLSGLGQEFYCESVGIVDVTIDGVDAKLKLYKDNYVWVQFVEFVDSSEYNGIYMFLPQDTESQIDYFLELVQISSKTVSCKVNPVYKELFNEQPSPFIYTGAQYVFSQYNLSASARCGHCSIELGSGQLDGGYIRAFFRIYERFVSPKIFCTIDISDENKPYVDTVFSRIKDTKFINELSHINLNGVGASQSELDYIDGKDSRLTCLKGLENDGAPTFCLVDYETGSSYADVYFVFEKYEDAETFLDDFHQTKIRLLLANEINSEDPKLALGTADFYNAMYVGTDFNVIG